ncbi:MAG: glycine cleavage system protein GcvH [bacterium]|nr:glycine cleavage system protein GcvH [bacterium]
MDFPKELKYTKDHEWVRIQGAMAAIGITEFAQSELGDLVFVDLPAIGKVVKQGETLCVVESTKAASDVYCPVGGKVIEVNTALKDSPDLVNKDSYLKGWLVKLSEPNSADLAKLMDAESYGKLVGK